MEELPWEVSLCANILQKIRNRGVFQGPLQLLQTYGLKCQTMYVAKCTWNGLSKWKKKISFSKSKVLIEMWPLLTSWQPPRWDPKPGKGEVRNLYPTSPSYIIWMIGRKIEGTKESLTALDAFKTLYGCVLYRFIGSAITKLIFRRHSFIVIRTITSRNTFGKIARRRHFRFLELMDLNGREYSKDLLNVSIRSSPIVLWWNVVADQTLDLGGQN